MSAWSGLDVVALLGVAAVVAGLVGVGVIGATVVVAVLRRRADRRPGVWWEITPPARVGPGTGVALWQTLGGLLRRYPAGLIHRRRIAVELVATPHGVRVGVWLPHTLRSAPIAPALRAAVPAADLAPAAGPDWPTCRGNSGGGGSGAKRVAMSKRVSGSERVAVVELGPRGGRWAPVLDPVTPTPRAGTGSGGGWAGDGADLEPLRAVYAALGRRSGGETATVQLVIRAHRGTAIGPGAGLGGGLGGGATGVVSGAVSGVLEGLTRFGTSFLLELLDILTGSPGRRTATRPYNRPTVPTTPVRGRPVDAVAASAVKARDAKRTAGPHLHVTLRVALATPAAMTARTRQARLGEIRGGFDLLTLPLRARWRRWRPGEALTRRTPGSGFLVTATELAALWHLPGEPARFGLTAPPARDHRPAPDLPHISKQPRPRPGQRRGPRDAGSRP